MNNTIYICPYCGMYHPNQICPRIKTVKYHIDGSIQEVEFHPALVDSTVPKPEQSKDEKETTK